MNPEKQHKKLLKVMSKACDCDNREQARKLIKKADKIQDKLEQAQLPPIGGFVVWCCYSEDNCTRPTNAVLAETVKRY